jgi:hypothetical protein
MMLFAITLITLKNNINMTDLDTISLEAAKLAKAQGFNLPTIKYFLESDGEINSHICTIGAIDHNASGKNISKYSTGHGIAYSAPTPAELNKWRTDNNLNDLRDDQREYPVPLENENETLYPDGVCLKGTWEERIAEWIKFNLHRIPKGH